MHFFQQAAAGVVQRIATAGIIGRWEVVRLLLLQNILASCFELTRHVIKKIIVAAPSRIP
jgi:hypothetical protein